jgi:hypothetical protein
VALGDPGGLVAQLIGKLDALKTSLGARPPPKAIPRRSMLGEGGVAA